MKYRQSISVIIGCHNSGQGILNSARVLGEFLSDDSEIILVENGSTDNTLELLLALKYSWAYPNTLKILESDKGLGNALSVGLEQANSEYIWITGDDLPFGFAEIDFLNNSDINQDALIVGSKSHPSSRYIRPKSRRIASFVFWRFRKLVLQLEVSDTQGTMLFRSSYAKSIAGSVKETGYLWTTEVIYILSKLVPQIIEIPVSGSAMNLHSRVKPRDSYEMFKGLFRIRRRHG